MIGLSAFVLSIGLQTVEVDETFDTGERTGYSFSAPQNAEQQISVSAESFDVRFVAPGNVTIPLASYEGNFTHNWSHLEDGDSRIEIQNTGQTEMHVTAVYHISTDPIFYTYHVLVMISGIVVIGVSAGFSARKPRGF
ncbi:hypothetical protein CENSYa_2012 [Cenarchaeum symbiosum A]|uniref:Uncharacterized protein n=1 Tax=Cenarchaeum symbiosum (strain A) TaxID=414004 RepID=A0RZ49_CENSY|nr:hypothetical protein CENSYa_2012 [Cenarchaeum symbiosum A]